MFLINDLCDYLVQQNVGLVSSGNTAGTIFVGFLPSTPDDCIALYATGGFPADGKWGYDEPTIQVWIRARTHIDAATKAQTVYDLFQGMHATTLPNGTYVVNSLGLQSAPTLIGRDTDERTEYSLNFRMRIRNRTSNRV